jgi:hypothetical protein
MSPAHSCSTSPGSCAPNAPGSAPASTLKLGCFTQPVLGLRCLRDRTAVARHHSSSRATAYRYRDEVLHVLAAQAPALPALLHATAHHDLPTLADEGHLDAGICIQDRSALLRTSASAAGRALPGPHMPTCGFRCPGRRSGVVR